MSMPISKHEEQPLHLHRPTRPQQAGQQVRPQTREAREHTVQTIEPLVQRQFIQRLQDRPLRQRYGQLEGPWDDGRTTTETVPVDRAHTPFSVTKQVQLPKLNRPGFTGDHSSWEDGFNG